MEKKHILITGTLASGKTTLLKKLTENKKVHYLGCIDDFENNWMGINKDIEVIAIDGADLDSIKNINILNQVVIHDHIQIKGQLDPIELPAIYITSNNFFKEASKILLTHRFLVVECKL